MTREQITSLPAALLLALSSISWAGERGQALAPDQETSATPATRVPAAQAPSDYLVLSIGPAAGIESADGRALGTMQDHVVDRVTGRVLYVVVETAGQSPRRALVPFGRFTWDTAKKELWLAAGEDELSRLPELDQKALQELGASGIDGVTPPAKPAEATAPSREALPRNLLASQIRKSLVLAQGAPFGTIADLVLDPRQGVVAFALVAPNKDAQAPEVPVVPWRALQRDEQGRYGLSNAAAQMAEAPALPRTDLGKLRDAAFLEALNKFYRTPAPASGA